MDRSGSLGSKEEFEGEIQDVQLLFSVTRLAKGMAEGEMQIESTGRGSFLRYFTYY